MQIKPLLILECTVAKSMGKNLGKESNFGVMEINYEIRYS
jgi:hypothetical protein